MIRFEANSATRSERQLLAALMREPSCAGRVRDVKPYDFSHGIHGELFRAIVEVIAAGETVDVDTVLGRVRARLRRVPDGWRFYLLDVWYSACAPANAGIYAAMMRMHRFLNGGPA